MSELYTKSQQKLELYRVLEMLSACASSPDGKSACLALTPSTDIDEVQQWLEETTVASNLSTHKGYPGFSGVVDVTASLDRAERGFIQVKTNHIHLFCEGNSNGHTHIA